MSDVELTMGANGPKPNLSRHWSLPGESDLAASATRLDIDLADRLPPPAAAKFRALRDEAEILRAQHMLPYRAMQEKNKLKNEILSRITELKSRERLSDDHPLIAKERQNVEILTSQLRVLHSEYTTLSEKTQAVARTVTRIERFLEDMKPSKLAMAPAAPAPKIARTSDIPAEIEKVRTKIARLVDERETVRNASLPTTTVKKIVSDFVNGLAANGRPDVFPSFENGAPPMLAVDERAQLPGMTRAPVDAIGLIAWLLRDKMIEAINSVVDEDADESSALSPEDRQTRLEGIERELLALERTEEILIALAREHLIHIPRRENTDIRALLGIDGPALSAD